MPFTYEAWRTTPSMYLVCKEDKALPRDAQYALIENARKEGADVTVFECEGSHSPFLSMPEKVVEALEMAAELGAEKKAS